MTLKRKRLVVNIVFYSLIVLIYSFVITLLIIKFNNGVIYLFNNRYDVVLTDSMSAKNPEHLDFLEGTTQIQRFDVVRSTKISEDTELYIKDVVLFKNPDLGNATTMHRIVEIKNYYVSILTENVDSAIYHEIKGINLNDYFSSISISDASIKYVEFEFISPHVYSNDYSLLTGGKFVNLSHESVLADGYYKNKVYYDNPNAFPSITKITRKNLLESYITNVKFVTTKDAIYTLSAEEYVKPESGEYQKDYIVRQTYRTRGDLAKDFDNNGNYFEKSDLISRVNTVIPKAGYAVRFFTSIPGVILLVGIALIITVASFLYNRGKKNDKIVEITNGDDSNVVNNNDNNETLDERKDNKDHEEKSN